MNSMLWEENFEKSAYSTINNSLSVCIPSQTINFSITKSFNWYFTRAFYDGSLRLINHDHVKFIFKPCLSTKSYNSSCSIQLCFGGLEMGGIKNIRILFVLFFNFPIQWSTYNQYFCWNLSLSRVLTLRSWKTPNLNALSIPVAAVLCGQAQESQGLSSSFRVNMVFHKCISRWRYEHQYFYFAWSRQKLMVVVPKLVPVGTLTGGSKADTTP